MDYTKIKKCFLNEKIVKEILEWKYDGKYSIYNLPSYEEMKKQNYNFVNKDNFKDYICYILEDEIVAYIHFKKIDDKIYFGIGLNPKYCGKGFGNYFIKDGIIEFKNRYKGSVLCIEVRSWNKRAIKSYEKAGFIKIKTIMRKDRFENLSEFIEMENRSL